MPDWGKLLMAYAEGANPEMFAKARAQKEEMVNNEQRRNLLASAEGRAQAEEGRKVEESNYNITRRGLEEKKFEESLKGLQLANNMTREQINDLPEVKRLRAEAAARDEKRVGFEGDRVKNDSAQLGLAQQTFNLNKSKADQEMGFEKEMQPYRIAGAERASDPREKYNAEMAAIAAHVRANPDMSEEDKQYWNERAKKIAGQSDAETFAWNQRRNARINPGGSNPPAGANAAFKGAKGEPFDKKTTPETVVRGPSGWSGSATPRMQDALADFLRRATSGVNASSEGF